MNKVELVGRLTKDPDLRTTQSGKQVIDFTLACDRRTKTEDGKREADFIPCQVWEQTADVMHKYCAKGDRIGIVGHIVTGRYEKDGKTVFTVKVRVDELEFLQPKKTTETAQETPPVSGDYIQVDDEELPF